MSALRREGGDLFIDTIAGPIKVTTDPTLRPNEIRMEQPTPCCAVSEAGYACKCHELTNGTRTFAPVTVSAEAMPPVNPLDIEYNGVKLRKLLELDWRNRREMNETYSVMDPAQRAAVSAYWSGRLRAKVAASAAADKARETSVVVDLEDW